MKLLFSSRHQGILAAFLTILATPSVGQSAPPTSAGARVSFPQSLAPLPNLAGAKATSPSPLVAASMTDLSAAQLAAPQDFHVAMAMRNFAEFQTRVSNGEHVPFEEMEAKYLPLPAEYAAVRAWMVGQGFAVTMDDERRLAIFLQGTPAQIQTSFGVKMQGVTMEGATYVAATTVPSLPASIAGGVLGINDLQPYLRPHRHVRLPAAVGPMPEASTSSPFTVPQVLKAYDATNLSVGGTTLTGANQKIAIVIDAFPATADLTGFWNANGIAQNLSNIEEINVPNGTIDKASTEETLDVEWSSSVAPGCKVRVYVSDTLSFTNINKCLSQIATDVSGTSPAQPAIHEMSMSLGIAETSLGKGSSTFTTESQYFATIANGSSTGGVSVFVSAGDGGSVPSGTLSPEYESSDPNVTGVGGTSLTTSAATGLRATEVVWDDVTAAQYAGFQSAGGTGGGTSIQFSRPSWQVGTGVPSGTLRLAPDVASVGAESSPGYLYFGGSPSYVAGTSWSSPTWAGIAALINQGRALNSPTRLPPGLLNPHIYPLIGTNNFFDVTSGNNTLGSSAAGTTNGVANYTAGIGYDECTGLGVPDVANLVNTLLGPTISSFTPSGGAAGSSVVITGTNFYTSTTLPLTVTFNGVAATSVTVNSATQITAVAPTGFSSGPIVVTSLKDAITSSTSFSTTIPDLTAASSHTGSFTQADTGDTYTLTVANAGTSATSGTVTLTDTLPSGLTATAMSGTGWTCNVSTLTATRSDALAAGSSYPVVTLTVNVAYNAPASVTNNVSVGGGGESNTSNDTGGDVTAITALTPTQSWRYQYFGVTTNTGNAADTANPAGDGIPNLLKYALGLSPLVPAANPETEDIRTGYLQLTVPKNPSATDLTYSVQVTGDLTDPTSWTASGTTTVQNTTSLLQVRDNTPVSGTAKRFIRLQVSR